MARDNHWNAYHSRWSQLTPPLRPDADVAAAMRTAIAGCDGRVVLLGVTPELADVARTTLAFDIAEGMVRHVWPGDTERRQARVGNWLALPLADGSVDAVLGDGSLNNLLHPGDYRRLFEELHRVLRPGGRVVLRTFVTPEPGESQDAVVARTLAGGIASFHAFKWHLAMALCSQQGDPNIAVTAILAGFERCFPDRGRLAEATGWSASDIDTIEAYRGSSAVYSFPTLREVAVTVSDRFSAPVTIAAGSYPLAERCPLIVVDLAG